MLELYQRSTMNSSKYQSLGSARLLWWAQIKICEVSIYRCTSLLNFCWSCSSLQILYILHCAPYWNPPLLWERRWGGEMFYLNQRCLRTLKGGVPQQPVGGAETKRNPVRRNLPPAPLSASTSSVSWIQNVLAQPSKPLNSWTRRANVYVFMCLRNLPAAQACLFGLCLYVIIVAVLQLSVIVTPPPPASSQVKTLFIQKRLSMLTKDSCKSFWLGVSVYSCTFSCRQIYLIQAAGSQVKVKINQK